MNELVIKDLHVNAGNKEILKGVNLTIKKGDFLALLGPNGHGKSTLLAAIMGNPHYEVTKGSITFDGKDVLKMSVDERSKAGLFLGFQNPYEIPGVISADFYKSMINVRNKEHVSLYNFYKSLETASKEVKIPMEMVNRSLNDGFSGGEKKRNEILQMVLLNPKFVMLDEIDSGLDVDAINVVSDVINKQKEKGSSFIVISHYARLFDLIKPNRTAVMINGKIAVEGGPEIFKRIDQEGYEWIKSELGIEVEKDTKEMNKVSIGVCATKELSKNGTK
ncbi:MAG: Fe-S cluster assembly ATPase SufC [Bacilli bacterium]